MRLNTKIEEMEARLTKLLTGMEGRIYAKEEELAVQGQVERKALHAEELQEIREMEAREKARQEETAQRRKAENEALHLAEMRTLIELEARVDGDDLRGRNTGSRRPQLPPVERHPGPLHSTPSRPTHSLPAAAPAWSTKRKGDGHGLLDSEYSTT